MSRRGGGVLGVGAGIGRDLTVLGQIGEGGGGRVYIVWNHRAWCPMAYKVSPSARRARQEAAVLAALDHPNIARFFGRRRPAGLLMEFLEGPTISRMIRARPRRRLSVSDAVRLAMHVGAALTHMHERGFLHLDVKPSNILVVRGRPVLVDFSTARRRARARLTAPEGTDAYMAPEQCDGGRLGPATDVFGLGALLYEALTGRTPFAGASRRQPFPQLTQPPVPLRRRAPEVPAPLERLVLACLEREPDRRPPSPSAILPVLHPFIRSGPAMWPAAVTERLAGATAWPAERGWHRNGT